jgi:archaellum component FlaC
MGELEKYKEELDSIKEPIPKVKEQVEEVKVLLAQLIEKIKKLKKIEKNKFSIGCLAFFMSFFFIVIFISLYN